HGLKMIGYIEQLDGLGSKVDNELSVDLILTSLPDSFQQFVINFHTNKIEATLHELINMLKTVEGTFKQAKALVLLLGEFSKGKKGKKNLKKTSKPLQAKGGVKKASTTEKKGTCFHCGKDGRWKTKWKVYFASLKDKPSEDSDICNNLQALTRRRTLSKGEVDLLVGNGARVATLTVGTVHLLLPSERVLELKNYFYV
ncbi:UBN2 domain-containing protein, partial [Cephalotus follicularis]